MKPKLCKVWLEFIHGTSRANIESLCESGPGLSLVYSGNTRFGSPYTKSKYTFSKRSCSRHRWVGLFFEWKWSCATVNVAHLCEGLNSLCLQLLKYPFETQSREAKTVSFVNVAFKSNFLSIQQRSVLPLLSVFCRGETQGLSHAPFSMQRVCNLSSVIRCADDLTGEVVFGVRPVWVSDSQKKYKKKKRWGNVVPVAWKEEVHWRVGGCESGLV